METTFYIKQTDIQLLNAAGCLADYDIPLHLVQFDQTPTAEWVGGEWYAHAVAIGAAGVYSSTELPFKWEAWLTTSSPAPIWLWGDDSAHGGQLLAGSWLVPLDGQTWHLLLDPYNSQTLIGYGGMAFQMAPSDFVAPIPEPSHYGLTAGVVMLAWAIRWRSKRVG